VAYSLFNLCCVLLSLSGQVEPDVYLQIFLNKPNLLKKALTFTISKAKEGFGKLLSSSQLFVLAHSTPASTRLSFLHLKILLCSTLEQPQMSELYKQRDIDG
jgi:hypothetical protein